MRVKFNKFERVAGLFVLTAMIGGMLSALGVAAKKGWFDERVTFYSILQSADGIRPGTLVQIAGLRAGVVDAIDLRPTGEVQVIFSVSSRFHLRIREDSVVRSIRPFIIGEKVIEVTMGSEKLPLVIRGGRVQSETTVDIMDLVSGKSLGPYLESVSKVMDSVKFLTHSMLDPKRSRALVRLFDEMTPLMKDAGFLAREASVLMKDINHEKRLIHTLDNLAVITDETKKLLPVISKNSPQLAEDLSKIARNMAVLTDELQKALPQIQILAQTVGPEVPRASRRAIEALDETVVTLKVLQKSFLLRGNVKDVRDEESQRDKRVPASQTLEPKP